MNGTEISKALAKINNPLNEYLGEKWFAEHPGATAREYGAFLESLINGPQKFVYIANCIEDGEKFKSYFYHTETDKDKLRELGQEIASEWGAECTSVKAWKPERYIKATNKKTGKVIETTVKQWDTWAKKYLPADCLNDDARNPYTIQSAGKEPLPDGWDYTKTREENMASSKLTLEEPPTNVAVFVK